MIVLAMLLLSAPADIERDFAAAGERALAGDNEQAVALYRSVLERGYDGADVHYNLGVALEDVGRPVDAIVAYERALWRNPGDIDAETNLARLRAATVRGAPDFDPDAASLGEVFGPWVRGLPVGLLGWSAALALLGACALRAAQSRVGLSNALFSVAAVFGIAVGLAAAVDGEERAVVTAAAPLRAGPDPRFESRASAVPGEPVRILKARGAFREVLRADGSTGWIERDGLALLRSPGV